jgi:hypothetical protein
MDNRDAIVNKLNALRAKANGASTPEEALAFANKYEELMRKYKLTETDLEVKSSKINSFSKAPPKKLDKLALVVGHIATLTDTVAVRDSKTKEFVFFGLPADLQYANWLYELIANTMDRSLNAFPASKLYHDMLKNKVNPKELKENYKLGFLAAIAIGLMEMIEANKVRGNALVVLKHGLILAEIAEQGETGPTKDKLPTLYDGAHEAATMGYQDGAKVKLRKEVESVVKGYLA